MSVNGSDVMEAHVFEQAAGHEHRAHPVFEVAGRLIDFVADMRDTHQEIAHVALGTVVLRRDADAREIFTHGSDIGIDGHLIVVEDDDEFGAKVACMIERLEGLAARQAPSPMTAMT